MTGVGLIEKLDIANNAVQIVVVGAATFWAVRCEMHNAQRRAAFHLLAGALFCFFLGDVFLLLHILFAGDSPIVFSAADLSYLGFYTFLTAVCLEEAHNWSPAQREAADFFHHTALLGPVAVVLFHIAYHIIYSDIFFNNLIYCLLMAVLVYEVLRHCLVARKLGDPMGEYHRVVLLYLCLEMVMYAFSSFGWFIPTIAMDFVLTFFYPLMVRAMLKGAGA